MTHRAGLVAYYHFSLFSDHVARERHRAIFSDGRARLLVPRRISHVGHRHKSPLLTLVSGQGIEDEFASVNPVSFRLEPSRIKDGLRNNLRLLLLEPIEIAWRLFAGRVDRIAFVDGPHRHAVIVVGGDV